MSLSDELAELRKPVPTCSVCRWYAEQSEADRAEFDECREAGVSAVSLLEVCARHGLGAKISAFRSHLRDECKAKP